MLELSASCLKKTTNLLVSSETFYSLVYTHLRMASISTSSNMKKVLVEQVSGGFLCVVCMFSLGWRGLPLDTPTSCGSPKSSLLIG